MSQRAEHSLWSRETEGCVFFRSTLSSCTHLHFALWRFQGLLQCVHSACAHGPPREGLITPMLFSSPPTLSLALPAVLTLGKGELLLTTYRCVIYILDDGKTQLGGGLFPQVGRDVAIMVNAIRCLEKSNHVSAESPGSCCGTWAASLFPERLRDAAMMKKPWS